MQESRKLEDYLIERPKPKGIDVLCGLKHFAIITYAVPSERFRGIFPERFQLDTVEIDGQEMGLISVVPFIDVDFTSAVFPFPKFTMGRKMQLFSERAKAFNIDSEVHYLDAPKDIRKKRIEKRNIEKDSSVYSFEVNNMMFNFMDPKFEAPDKKELENGRIVNA